MLIEGCVVYAWASVYVCDVVEVQCHIVDDFCMQLTKSLHG